MPNPGNIEAPITLIGYGRSGTSLVSSLFDIEHTCRYVGETTDLIYGVWDALESRFGTIVPQFKDGRMIGLEARAAKLVRDAFLSAFPDPYPFWFHKPIGLPTVLPRRFSEEQWDDAAAWYWTVQRAAFPRAKYFTVIRHPCDVVLSGKDFWHFQEPGLWWGLGAMAFLITHRSSPVEYAVFYDDLVVDPQSTVEKLFRYLRIPLRGDYLRHFQVLHAPAPGRERRGEFSPSRQQQWNTLDPANAAPVYRDLLSSQFQRFGRTLTYPRHFLVSRETAKGDTEATEATVTAEAAEAAVDRLHRLYQARLKEQERQSHADWSEQQEWIGSLERAKASLEERHTVLLEEVRRLTTRLNELESGGRTATAFTSSVVQSEVQEGQPPVELPCDMPTSLRTFFEK